MKRLLIASLFMVSAVLVSSPVPVNAAYPHDKAITLVVPFGPGGAVDIASRIISDYFQHQYKITINVVNKPGGGQAVGLNEMLRARPDGYTFCFPGFGGPSITTKLSNVGFTHKDLKAVAQITVMEPVFTTHTAYGIPTFAAFLERAKTDPEHTMYGTTGAITTQRLYMTKLLSRFHPDIKLRHTAFGSGHEVSTSLLGKHITAGFQVPTNILPYIKSGDFACLAISRHTRSQDLPDTPTFRELYADKLTPADDAWIDLGSWHGLVTSKRVPDKLVAEFQPYLTKCLEDPAVIEKFKKVGLSVDYLAPKDFEKVIQTSSDLVDEVLAGRKSLD